MQTPLLFVALSAVLLGACFSPGDGLAPPLKSLYFPTGLALDVVPKMSSDPSIEPDPPDAPKHLFVASSDFDLQYKASALASYDAHDDVRKCTCRRIAQCRRRTARTEWTCDCARSASVTIRQPRRRTTRGYFCVDDKSNPTPCASIGPDAVPSTAPCGSAAFPGALRVDRPE